MARLALFVRYIVVRIASLAVIVSLFLLLYRQFHNETAQWPGVVLAAGLVVCCLEAWPRWAAVDKSLKRSRRWAGRGIHDVAWVARSGLLAAAAFYYGAVRLNEERVDWALAGLSAGMIACALLQRCGRAMGGGRVDWGFLRGRRLGSTLVRWGLYVFLGAAAREIGYLLSVAVFWIPVRTLEAFGDWWSTDWLALPAAVVVWLLWLIVFGLISGVLQAYDLQKHRHTESQTFGQSFGSYFSSTAYEQTFSSSFSYTTHEQFYDTVLQGPPPRTMLAPLLDFHYTVGGWTSSRSTTGSMYDSFSTTSAFGQWRVYRFQFPPAYVPIWLAAMIRLVRRRGGEADR